MGDIVVSILVILFLGALAGKFFSLFLGEAGYTVGIVLAVLTIVGTVINSLPSPMNTIISNLVFWGGIGYFGFRVYKRYKSKNSKEE